MGVLSTFTGVQIVDMDRSGLILGVLILGGKCDFVWNSMVQYFNFDGIMFK